MTLDTVITAAMLDQAASLGACQAAIDRLRLAPCRLRDLPPPECGWAAAYAHGLTLSDREALADASGDPRYWRDMIAAYAPGLTLIEREALADASDAPRYWRGEIAAHAPGLTLIERKALADASNDPGRWRDMIAAAYAPESRTC